MQGMRKITEPTDWATVDCGEPVVNLLMAVYHDTIKDACRELRHQNSEFQLLFVPSDDVEWMNELLAQSCNGSPADVLIRYMIGVESGRCDDRH